MIESWQRILDGFVNGTSTSSHGFRDLGSCSDLDYGYRKSCSSDSFSRALLHHHRAGLATHGPCVPHYRVSLGVSWTVNAKSKTVTGCEWETWTETEKTSADGNLCPYNRRVLPFRGL